MGLRSTSSVGRSRANRRFRSHGMSSSTPRRESGTSPAAIRPSSSVMTHREERAALFDPLTPIGGQPPGRRETNAAPPAPTRNRRGPRPHSLAHPGRRRRSTNAMMAPMTKVSRKTVAATTGHDASKRCRNGPTIAPIAVPTTRPGTIQGPIPTSPPRGRRRGQRSESHHCR